MSDPNSEFTDVVVNENERSVITLASLELSKCEKWLKWLLISFNIVEMIFACVLIAVGSYALSGKAESISGVTLPSGIIVFGVFFLLLSFLGCFAGFRENRALLAVYFFIVLLLCLILFFIGISVLVHKKDAGDYMKNGWESSSDDVRLTLENYFSCCGLEQNSTFANTFEALPCPPLPRDVTIQRPCLPILQDRFYNSFDAAGGCGVAFSILLGFYMIACIQLFVAVGRRKIVLDKLNSGIGPSRGGASSEPNLHDNENADHVNPHDNDNSDEMENGNLTKNNKKLNDIHSFDNEY